MRADLETLLPGGSPVAEDYRLFLEHFGGLEQVFVLILAGGSAEGADLATAADLLEEILAASPEVESVSAGIDEDDEHFFLNYVASRAPLLIPGEDWAAAVERRLEPEAIRERMLRLKAIVQAPDGIARGALARVDPLGFSDELPINMGAAALPIDPLTQNFLAPSGDAALLMLIPKRSEIDPEGGRALAAELETAFKEVRDHLGTSLEFRALGGPLYAAQDERLLRQDLRRTVTGSLAGASAILITAFGGLILPAAALVPLVVGLLWTAGWLGLTVSDLSAIAIGFGAVLVGLGLDYGIHAAARLRQESRPDTSVVSALTETVRHTGPGIVTSALTTAFGFAALSPAHFRPLSELGLLVAFGILSILIALVLLGAPAALAIARRLRQSDPPGGHSRGARGGAPGTYSSVWCLMGRIVDGMSDFGRRRSRWVLTASAMLCAGALWSLPDLRIDPDLRALRPENHPVYETESLLVDRFGLGLDTANMVVPGRDLPQALERAAGVAAALRRDLGSGARLSSPADYLTLGEPVAERLRRLAEMPLARAAADLERELTAANLNPRAFTKGLEALRAMARGEDPGGPPEGTWPKGLARSLAVGDDGAWVSISLRLAAGTWPAGPPAELVEGLESLAPGLAVASAAALGPELRSLATEDVRTLSLLALAAVATVVLLSFRGRPGYSLMAGLPVLLGSLWTLGLWAALGRSLDLFTLAVLPIMLGIGIDDGLHVLHGARRRPASGIVGAVRGAGRALLLTTLTTCVGFGSLLLSHIPGLRNGGLLIAAGVLACLLATVVVLPAIEALGERRTDHG